MLLHTFQWLFSRLFMHVTIWITRSGTRFGHQCVLLPDKRQHKKEADAVKGGQNMKSGVSSSSWRPEKWSRFLPAAEQYVCEMQREAIWRSVAVLSSSCKSSSHYFLFSHLMTKPSPQTETNWPFLNHSETKSAGFTASPTELNLKSRAALVLVERFTQLWGTKSTWHVYS